MAKLLLSMIIWLPAYGLAIAEPRLSELMICPAQGCEWIELTAMEDIPTDVHIVLADRAGHISGFALTQPVLRGSYLIVAADLSVLEILELPHNTLFITPTQWPPNQWPSLNDDGDRLYLMVESDTIEVLEYTAGQAPPRGHSLERISYTHSAGLASNWGECADPKGNTAGRDNSLHTASEMIRAKLWADPNPFYPRTRGETIKFYFLMPAASSRATLDIFTADGRPLVRIVEDIPIGPDAPPIQWDGHTARGWPARGRYVAVFKALAASGESYMAKCSIVVGD